MNKNNESSKKWQRKKHAQSKLSQQDNFINFYGDKSYGYLEYDKAINEEEKPLSQIINNLSKKYNFDKQLLLANILKKWKNIIGEDNASLCTPNFWDSSKNILYIAVKDSMTLFHFQRDKLLQQEVLEAIKDKFPEIKQIRFQASH